MLPLHLNTSNVKVGKRINTKNNQNINKQKKINKPFIVFIIFVMIIAIYTGHIIAGVFISLIVAYVAISDLDDNKHINVNNRANVKNRKMEERQCS